MPLGCRGFNLPLREEELLDVEFVQDTMMELSSKKTTLPTSSLLCDRLGAKINGHKSCGFWAGEGTLPL